MSDFFATPWTAAHQASLTFTVSRSLLRLMSIESVMPFNSEYSGGSVWPLFVLPHFQDILSCLLHPKHVFIFMEGRKYPPQDQKEGLECSLVPFLIISAL